MTSNNARSIVVVEDSHEEFHALEWACRASSITIPLIHCENGEEAFDYLSGAGKYCQTLPSPGLVLLDLNMPRISGKEVLRYIKTSDQLNTLPVIIFSSSANPKDIAECYREGANSYIVKPLGLKQIRSVMESLAQYWFNLVEQGPEIERHAARS